MAIPFIAIATGIAIVVGAFIKPSPIKKSRKRKTRK